MGLLFSFFQSGQALAQEPCEFLNPWLQAQKALQMVSTDFLKNVMDASDRERKSREEIANDLFKSYLHGERVKSSSLRSCLGEKSDRANFLFTMNEVFIQNTFAILQQSKSPSIRRLMNLIRQTYGNQIPLIRTVDSKDHDPLLPYRAGFHRGSGSIVLDIEAIAPEEWVIIFIHETLHALDTQLYEAMQIYSKKEVPEFLAKQDPSVHFENLDPKSRTSIEEWLMAGIGRGLLAEYRAWVPTLTIYREGLAEGLWGHVNWIDQVIASKESSQSLDRFTFQFLDQRSPDPTDGIFAVPLAAESLKKLRLKLRNQRQVPPLGILGSLINPKSIF